METRGSHLHHRGFLPEFNERKAHGRIWIAAYTAVHDLATFCKVLSDLRLSHLQTNAVAFTCCRIIYIVPKQGNITNSSCNSCLQYPACSKAHVPAVPVMLCHRCRWSA